MCLEQVLPIPSDLLPQSKHVLLMGESGTFKSSLLFQFCQTILRQRRQTVALYICAQDVRQLPLRVHQMPIPSTRSCSSLHVIYLSTLEDLLEYVANLYTLEAQISAIAIDDLHLLINRRRNPSTLKGTFNFNLGKLFALLMDTIQHMQRRQNLLQSLTIRLLIASGYDSHPIACAAGLTTVGRQYFDQVYSLTKADCVGSDQSAVELHNEERGIKIRIVQRSSMLFLDRMSRRRVVRS